MLNKKANAVIEVIINYHEMAKVNIVTYIVNKI